MGRFARTRDWLVAGWRGHWLAVLFVALLLIPLYLLLVSVVVRSDLLRFWGEPYTADQFKALFAFLGVALGVAATTLGALLTKLNNDRTLAQKDQSESLARAQKQESERLALAQKEESERRIRVETHESNARQKLDTAIQVLNLIKNGDQYAGKAVTGAGIATLVVLGYPVIAMRALQAAMNEGVVDTASATWVIEQVLIGDLHPRRSYDGLPDGPPPQTEPLPTPDEAIQLLYDHAPSLTKEGEPGAFDWPASALGQWPSGLNVQCGWTLMFALLRLLVARDPTWWTSGDDTWSWVVSTLYKLSRDETADKILRGEAATYALLLLPALHGAPVNDGANPPMQADRVRAALLEQVEPGRVPSSIEMQAVIEAWVRKAHPRR